MEDEEDQDPRRGSSDFVESSILDTIVPQATDFDIEESLKGSVERLDDATGSPLSSIVQRKFLFFGESFSNFYAAMSYLFLDFR